MKRNKECYLSGPVEVDDGGERGGMSVEEDLVLLHTQVIAQLNICEILYFSN